MWPAGQVLAARDLACGWDDAWQVACKLRMLELAIEVLLWTVRCCSDAGLWRRHVFSGALLLLGRQAGSQPVVVS